MTVPAGETPSVQYKETCHIRNNGDVKLEFDLIFSPPMYVQQKKAFSYPEKLLGDLKIMDDTQELVDGKIEWDDKHSRIKVQGTLLGAIYNENGGWSYRIKNSDRFKTVGAHPDSIMLFALTQMENGVPVSGTTRLNFPQDAKNINFDNRRGQVTWKMIPPKSDGQTTQTQMNLKVHTASMQCLIESEKSPKSPKLWIAKAIFKNKGPGAISDFKIRFRLRSYSNWNDWKTRPIVHPTQTVIEVFYPAMNEELCSLMDKTPVLLEVAWKYRRPDGKLINDYDARIITILGADQVVSAPQENLYPLIIAGSPSFTLENIDNPHLFQILPDPTPPPVGSPTPEAEPTICPPSPFPCPATPTPTSPPAADPNPTSYHTVNPVF